MREGEGAKESWLVRLSRLVPSSFYTSPRGGRSWPLLAKSPGYRFCSYAEGQRSMPQLVAAQIE